MLLENKLGSVLEIVRSECVNKLLILTYKNYIGNLGA